MKCHAIILAVLVLALSGCGHDVYKRADTTDTQYIQDENACFAQADQQLPAAVGYVNGGYQMNIEKKRNDIRSCMIAKGYTLEPKWPLGPYGTSPTTGPNPADQILSTRH